MDVVAGLRRWMASEGSIWVRVLWVDVGRGWVKIFEDWVDMSWRGLERSKSLEVGAGFF